MLVIALFSQEFKVYIVRVGVLAIVPHKEKWIVFVNENVSSKILKRTEH